MVSSIIQAPFFKIKIQPIMREQEINDKDCDFLNAEKISEINVSSLQLPSNHKLLDNAIWVVLENKTNATPHLNIGSLKIPIEEEFHKMSEEFILKASKSFWRCVDTIIEKKKWRPYWVNLLFFFYGISTSKGHLMPEWFEWFFWFGFFV